MRRAVVATLGLIVLVVLSWGVVRKERLLREGETILLPLLPRDPRSFMQGSYMALRYDLPERLSRAAQQRGSRRGLLVVQLDREGRVSFVRLHEPGGELSPRERLVKYVLRGGSLEVGASTFLFEDGAAEHYESARFGELILAPDGATLLVGLRDERLRRLGPRAETEREANAPGGSP